MNAAIDSIYHCLILGYFSMGEYDKCTRTFKRYAKVIKGKVVMTGNDASIHAYYYLSRWISTKSNQYVLKLQLLLNRKEKDEATAVIKELISYFKVPTKNSARAGEEVLSA